MERMSANALLHRRLYRSLLKASKPFSPPSPHASTVTCLLHRSGNGDGLDIEKYLADKRIEIALHSNTDKRCGDGRSIDEARDLSKSYANEKGRGMPGAGVRLDQRGASVRIYFRQLLREVVGGVNGITQMQFPKHADTTKLSHAIRREFRLNDSPFDLDTRKEVAFLALRILNMKLAWLESLNLSDSELEAQKVRNRRQAARHVHPLPLDPEIYLQRGTFLIAHPHLAGYFRQSVVCLIDHTERDDLLDEKKSGGTYGIVINKPGVNPSTGRDQTLRDVFRTFPKKIMDSFGDYSIRHGGPVHLSLQMLHAARPPDQPSLNGKVLTMIADQDTSAARYTDRAVYFQGDVLQAADAVTEGQLDRDDVSFYVGASCWEVGQLESEIQQGCWLPCRGPPEMALTGTCDHVGDDDHYDKETERPRADLWLSLMCAMGNDEATMAHLLSKDEYNDYDDVCDDF